MEISQGLGRATKNIGLCKNPITNPSMTFSWQSFVWPLVLRNPKVKSSRGTYVMFEVPTKERIIDAYLLKVLNTSNVVNSET